MAWLENRQPVTQPTASLPDSQHSVNHTETETAVCKNMVKEKKWKYCEAMTFVAFHELLSWHNVHGHLQDMKLFKSDVT